MNPATASAPNPDRLRRRRLSRPPARPITKLIGLLALLALPLVALHRPGESAEVAARLTVLHTNDTHGHLLPFSYPTLVPPGSPLEGIWNRSNIGGIARRATMVKRIREEAGKRGIPVWLVDAGDFSDGTAFSTEYQGEADIEAMNALGYTMATLGNHDFNHGLAQTRKLIRMAKFPFLCANVTVTATGKPFSAVSQVVKVGPVRVGVFGLTIRSSGTYRAAREGLSVAGEIETARSVVASLRDQSDIVVLVSHAGQETDLRMAREVPGIDVIIGGHSHTRLPSGEFVWRSEDLEPDSVNGTIVVQAHQWGGELGRLDLLFERGANGQWRVARYRERLLAVTADVAEDPEVAAVVARYWNPIASRFAEVLGEADGDFSSRGDDQAEYNLVADAVRETYHVDVALENPGGVRAPLVSGPVTLGDLIEMDPFDNKVVTFRMRGRELRRVLEQHSPYVSGIRYRVQDGRLLEATVAGRPIDDAREYTGVTNTFAAERYLKGIETAATGQLRSAVLLNYIRDHKTIRPAYDGRRVVINTRPRRPPG